MKGELHIRWKESPYPYTVYYEDRNSMIWLADFRTKSEAEAFAKGWRAHYRLRLKTGREEY